MIPSFLVTLDGVIAYSNSSARDLLGFAEGELIGRNYRDLLHQDDRPLAQVQARDLANETIGSFQAERRYQHKNGTEIWVLTSVSLLKVDGFYPHYFSVQALNIDGQKRAEAALAHSERRWAFALESAGQGVWEADIVKNTVYYSPMWKFIRGYASDEIVDSSVEAWLDRVHPDDRERIKETTRKQNSGEIKRNAFEYRERHKDGHYIWISSRGAPDAWAVDGTPVRLIGTDTDITQHKLAQQRERELSHRLELALRVSKIGVFEGNLKTGELIWDDRVREIFGMSPEDTRLTASDWEAALHPDDAQQALAAIDQAVARKSAFSQRYRIVRPDGQVRTIAAHGTYFEKDDGTPKFIGANADITEEVALAEGLRAAKVLAEARNIELEAAKARIESQSLHDALTGLPNRRYLDNIITSFATRNEGEEGTGLAILHIDLDRFKEINDTLGHTAGDEMLRHVARLLLELASPEDFVARVGGDEFVLVCLSQTSPERLAQLAERIISTIQQPVPYEGYQCRFGASIGIAMETGKRIDARRMLINGDMALYKAKARGRNRYEFFSKALQDEVESTKRIADDILRGVEAHEFVPFYQPVVDAKTLDVVGVEALVRWIHPTEGILSPARFLRIAEDLDVLASIDSHLLSIAIKDLEIWQTSGLPIQSVSVNVSFRRLSDEQLIPNLRALNIQPGTISFEFLESIFLDEVEDQVSWNIDSIREMGIGIDVDDFGTGHTSFVSLLKLNPRRLKIDRQLVAPIAESQDQRHLVSSIIEIGRTLGIGVVAEGVETLEIARILRDLGCDYLQGFAFAKPMPADQLSRWLLSSHRPRVVPKAVHRVGTADLTRVAEKGRASRAESAG